MAIVRFDKEEVKENYLEWRRVNPDGYVLNINVKSERGNSINRIHSAHYCPSLDNTRKDNMERIVTTEHHKLCSVDVNELINEMEEKGLAVAYCKTCKPNLNPITKITV